MKVSELFDRVVQLAEKRGRIPVGRWTVDLPDGFSLRVNGSGEEWENVPPYHALFTSPQGWPAALVTVNAGTVIDDGTRGIEDKLITVMDRALAEVPA